jgi:hypothetical protein
VVHDEDGDVMLALEGTEVAKQGRDLAGVVLVDAVEPDKGVKHIVPPLAGREAELDRIIAEYAADAIAELAAPAASFTTDDHAWVRNHAAGSLAEIEVATVRLVAFYTSRNLSHAAARLGMAPVSLSRWFGRRELPRMMPSEHWSHR